VGAAGRSMFVGLEGSTSMATGLEVETDIPLGTAERYLSGEVARPLPRGIMARPMPAGPAALAFDREDWSTPDFQTFSTSFRRSFRTMTPFVVSDVLALALSGLAVQGLLHWLYPPAAAQVGWAAAPLALLPLLLGYWLCALYSEIWVHPVIEFRQITIVNTLALLAAAAGGMLARPFPLWCGTALVIAVCLVPLLRTVTRYFCVNRWWWGYPTLLIGTGEGAAALARMLLETPRSALRPVLLTDPESKCRTCVMPVINDLPTLESLIRVQGIRHAVVWLPDLSMTRLGEMLDRYSGLVPHVLVLSDASTLPSLWGASRSFGRLSGIEIRNGLLMATLQGLKRAFDIMVAVTGLVLGLPLLLLIALLIKLTSKGPIFYSHKRIGRRGRQFRAWKFRTMHSDGDRLLRELIQRVAAAREEWDRDHKLRNDPRVTWFGRLLRKTSLDELPQLWNVLKGDMSIVGPRPIVEGEVPRYGNVFRQYTTVKPGITGLWQVSGRNDIGYDERVLLDQFYIRHWSPWLDVYILAKTIVAMIKREGAY
jgi:Undecaprenyl-phosphate galactose phosphotransferase WbaP